jgi:1-acyl-sn-glycerol-3-phosphate acyltransferase
MRTARAAGRLLLLTGLILGSLPSGFLSRTAARRAAWMQRLSGRILGIFGASVRVSGQPPASGLLIGNHLGYLDVLAVGSIRPAVFVAKSDVARWPVIGLLCRLAGTVFVRRDRRIAVGGTVDEIQAALAAGIPVVIFPEGTSTDGSTVLPFKSSLLAPVEHTASTAFAISYVLPGGSVADELCYWRDMTFGPHFWHLLGLREYTAHVRYGKTHPPQPDRKLAAAALHLAVKDLL